MQNRKLLIGLLAVLLAGVGWYLFRPERLWVNQRVNESLAAPVQGAAMAGATAPVAEWSGAFHSVAHATHGTATIYRDADGKRVLRFTDFETSNGPDVQVYLVQATDASDNATVTRSGFARLASLKGNIGDQNYEIPADLDMAKYHAVTIWCRRFGVNFATAPLQMVPGSHMPAEGPRAEVIGMFHGVAHATHGTATVYSLADGKRLLRLTDFETSNGPDVRVYMVAAQDASDNATVTKAGFVELGPLKGNVGDQNYELPASLNLNRYRAVTIWCHRFGVNFATAPLAPQHS
jgi:electron transfer DM13